MMLYRVGNASFYLLHFLITFSDYNMPFYSRVKKIKICFPIY